MVASLAGSHRSLRHGLRKRRRLRAFVGISEVLAKTK